MKTLKFGYQSVFCDNLILINTRKNYLYKSQSEHIDPWTWVHAFVHIFYFNYRKNETLNVLTQWRRSDIVQRGMAYDWDHWHSWLYRCSWSGMGTQRLVVPLVRYHWWMSSFLMARTTIAVTLRYDTSIQTCSFNRIQGTYYWVWMTFY